MRNNLAYLFGQAGVSETPNAGSWYQVKKGDTVWAISKAAYADTGLTSVKAGLFLLNDNPSNANIKKAKTGWESYNVKGLQLTPKYAAGVYYASYGTGSAYPLLWIPPTDGRTADQMGSGKGEKGDTGETGQKGDTGSQGIPGPQGEKGEQGEQGEPGHTPTNAEIMALISDYMEKNPVGIDSATVARAVADYLKANPPAGIDPDAIAAAVADYLKANPPAGIDSDAIAAAVAAYLKANPVEVPAVDASTIAAAVADYLKANPIAQGAQGPQGERGIQGERGPQGLPGATPTDAQISALISDYMEKNPPASTGTGFDMDMARDFVDARIRIAARKYLKDLTGGGTAAAAWPGLIAAGIFGGAIVVLLARRKSKVGSVV